MKEKQDCKPNITQYCSWIGISRDAYYKDKLKTCKEEFNEAILVKMVLDERKVLAKEGYKKLYLRLKPSFEELAFNIGRDKFLKYLRTNDLLVKKTKKYISTTNSKHRFYKYENLLINYKPTRPDEVYVSDITYIRVGKTFMYLALVTDLFSRKIVGYDLSESLNIEGSLGALKMALNQRKDKELPLMHHSDRGIQYCSNAYVNILKKANVKISMAGKGNCYDNAVAERVNGILKTEFELGQTILNKKIAHKLVKDSIYLYNEIRLHMSLGYLTPNKVHAA
jgi:transposase InsO family protein